MNNKGYLDLPGLLFILLFIWVVVIIYAIYKKETNTIVIKALDYKVGMCIIPHNGTGPFVITEIKQDQIYKNICVKNYIKVPEKYVDYSTNVTLNAESCMPIEFWDNMIVEYKWNVKEACNE